jgi:hypothetical protein
MLYASNPSEVTTPFDFWVKTLYLYGPFAASVFCLALMEPRARSQFKNGDIPHYVAIPVYALTWVAILAFLIIGQFFWARINSEEATIKGQFELRTKEQTISSRKASFFLKKQYDPGRPGYEFRIVTPTRMNEGEKIPFLLDPGTGKDTDFAQYELTVHAAYYEQGIEITYHPAQKNLFKEGPGRFEVKSGDLREFLMPQDDAASTNGSSPSLMLS